ncbi:MAG: DUF6473 family protein [Pseudomonadota bacterium]
MLPLSTRPVYDPEILARLTEGLSDSAAFSAREADIQAFYQAHDVGQYQKRDWRHHDYNLHHLDGLAYPIRDGHRVTGLGVGEYFAVLGSASSFGSTVGTPYGAYLSAALGLPCLNLSHAGAGPEFYLKHHWEAVEPLLKGARFVLIEAMPARSVSNSRFRSIFGRGMAVDRADASRRDQMHKHMIALDKAGETELANTLILESLERYEKQMTRLIRACDGKAVLVWFSQRRPAAFRRGELPGYDEVKRRRFLSNHPQFVDAEAVRRLCNRAGHSVLGVGSPGLPEQLVNRFTGEPVAFRHGDTKRSQSLQTYYPSSQMHAALGAALVETVAPLMA